MDINLAQFMLIMLFSIVGFIQDEQREKRALTAYANNESLDQPAHPYGLFRR